MLVALLLCEKDGALACDLLKWIGELGGCRNHNLLIVADAGTAFTDVIEARTIGAATFKTVSVITNGTSVKGWPAGCWSLFQTAIHNVKEPFLILEPDAVPLKAGWLDEIANLYSRLEAPAFLGHIYECKQPFMPERLMSGIAVYPANTKDLFPAMPEPQHWDVFGAQIMTQLGSDTPLIRHHFGTKELPPIFVRQKHLGVSPVNALTLADVPDECVLWHRDKTHSLIRILRGVTPAKIVVCFNVHAGDIGLAVTHSAWLRKLGRQHEHKAIICHDPSCPITALNALEINLRAAFTEVDTFVYSRPPIPGYPAAANWAFQSVALHMAKQKSPWLWFESDAIALKPDWLEQLQAEYDECGASWMGPVVQHMNHLQGTAIYPADAAQRMPNAMRAGERVAFDMEGDQDTRHDRHDASRLMFHCWTVLNGQFCPVGGGEVPANISLELARTIPKTAVFAHRFKDESLLRLLMSGEFRL